MKRFKWSGAVSFAAAASLGLVVSTSASAAQTDLCKIEESPCPLISRWEQGVNVEVKAEPFKLLTSLGNVECTSSTLKGPLGAGGAPQAVALESFVFVECKRGAGSCTVEALGLGNLDLLRTNVNLGEGTLLRTEIKFRCGLFINCRYEGEPKFHLLGKNGAEQAKLTASEVVMTSVGGPICPEISKLDAIYTIITPLPVYVME
jgi:hypothetical protein